MVRDVNSAGPTANGWLDQFEIPRLPVRRFSVGEYHRLIAGGFFAQDDRFELIEGWIVPRPIRTPLHDAAVMSVAEAIRRRLPPDWHLRIRSGFTTADSEPEPDLVLVRGRPFDYADRHPGPRDAAVVIEVLLGRSIEFHAAKRRLYARADVNAYWEVDPDSRHVDVSSSAVTVHFGSEFRTNRRCDVGDVLAVKVQNVELFKAPLTELLPQLHRNAN